MIISQDLLVDIFSYLDPRQLYILYAHSEVFTRAIEVIGKYSIINGMLFHEKFYGEIFRESKYLVSLEQSVIFYGHQMYKLKLQESFPVATIFDDPIFMEQLMSMETDRRIRYAFDKGYYYVYFNGRFYRAPKSNLIVKSYVSHMTPMKLLFTGVHSFCGFIDQDDNIRCYPLKADGTNR